MSDANAPLVCICIPTYNAEKTIAATLRSVLAQTYRNMVIHVVDNHSADGTLAVVESFADLGSGRGSYWADRGYEWYAGI